MSEQIMRPLDLAAQFLLSVRKSTRSLKAIPPLFIIGGLAIMTVSEYLSEGRIGWYKEPFLLLIMITFIIAQIVVMRQLGRITNGEKKSSHVLRELMAIGSGISLTEMRDKILKSSSPGHMRDALIRWIDLGSRGETNSFNSLMNNNAARRGAAVHKQMAIPITLNRILLKLGFIGTLIGLAMTFPPMKEAILSLDVSGEEGGFVKKIADAIDGDAYAILTTLVATAFSVLVEGVLIHQLR